MIIKTFEAFDDTSRNLSIIDMVSGNYLFVELEDSGLKVNVSIQDTPDIFSYQRNNNVIPESWKNKLIRETTPKMFSSLRIDVINRKMNFNQSFIVFNYPINKDIIIDGVFSAISFLKERGIVFDHIYSSNNNYRNIEDITDGYGFISLYFRLPE